MNPLRAYQHSVWLSEPTAFQRLAARVLAYKTCFTMREIVEARAERLASIRADLEGAIVGNGIDSEIVRQECSHLSCMRCGSTVSYIDRAQVQCDSGCGIEFESDMKAEAPKTIRAVKGKVGIIPIHGPVDQRLSSELMKAGGTPLDYVSQAIDRMASNDQVGAIVLHMDCPGGTVYGVQELSDKIYAARGSKPIYAMVDSMACSAGYWIASAATMMICTPGGDVGSVGVYIMHVDESAAMEAEGIKVTMVHAGKHKVEMAPFAPLSEEAKAELQGRVDAIETKFHAALKRNRNTSTEDVRANYGQGRVIAAEPALRAGMIDRIMTFDALMQKLTGGGDVPSSRGPSAEVLLKARQLRQRRELSKLSK